MVQRVEGNVVFSSARRRAQSKSSWRTRPVEPVTDQTDWAQRFIDQLCLELDARGIKYGNGYHEVVVEGVDFDAFVGSRHTVVFCGGRFNAGSAPYRYNVEEAANHMLRELPERKENNERRKRKENAEKQAAAIPRLRGINITATYNGEIELRFNHPDKATIMAAMDCLSENGFIDEQAPKVVTTYMVVTAGYACYGPFLRKWQADSFAASVDGKVVEMQAPVVEG